VISAGIGNDSGPVSAIGVENDERRVPTGIAGLDEVLCGGLLPGRTYLVRGGPGVGKTALGLHFLVEGLGRGERVAFLSHGTTTEMILGDARSLGLDASGIEFLDFTPGADFFAQSRSYDLFASPEVEGDAFASEVVARFEALQPRRVFLDALTLVRHLSSDPVDFRRYAQAFLSFLTGAGATVIFASGSSDRGADEDLQFMADGVINLDYSPTMGRTVTISKLRGSGFRLGRHSVKIDDEGLHVFPRLLPEAFGREPVRELVPSGIAQLDAMLHGGIERGAVTLITGPTGVGKTTLGTQFMKEAAARGERSVVYTFEETTTVLCRRSEGISIPFGEMLDEGTLSIVEVEPLHYTPDQFALLVRDEVERREARMVMIDSSSGYRVSMQGEKLTPHLHALCKYLKNMGVTVLLVYEVPEITGEFRVTGADGAVSYLADNIVFLRYVELDGELRRVVGVLKKRTSDFEKKLRELTITSEGVKVGEPLAGLRGILTGLPTPTRVD
jgi:circadian clock protein KaiC